MPHLDISLLGQFRLCCDRSRLSFTQSRLQALLAYLLLKRHAPQSRQQLAFLLWPDSSDSQAQSNLRTQLSRLRQSLPQLDRFLAITAKTIQWRTDAPFTLDVAQFEEAIARADRAEMAGDSPTLHRALDRAVAVYGGELLPGHYDDWLFVEREHLSQRYLRALERLIALLESQRAYGAAIEQAQRLLRQDPLHEEGYQTLIRLQTLSGDRAGALRTYQICATTLERELGVEPGAALREAHQRLLHMEKTPAVSSSALSTRLTLVGRQQEWQQVQTAWQTTIDGQARLLVIGGEMGMGKTRLAEELLDWAERQGITVATARSYAAEGALAYGPVTDWLRSERLRTALSLLEDIWLSEVIRLLPELLAQRPHLPPPGHLTEAWQRQRFFEALAHALFATERPLMLLLDDLQWCDGETLNWLHYLLRFPSKGSLLVVATVRSGEVNASHPLGDWLTALRRDDRLIQIELGPLDQAETTALAAQVVGQGLLPPLAEQLYRETEGNPLFVVETMRAIGNQTVDFSSVSVAVDPQSPVADVPPSASTYRPLPPRIQAVVQSRLNHLSPEARDLACLAATIGRAFTVDILSYLYDGEEKSMVNGLDELWQRRIIRDQGAGTYDFSHDKLREVVYTGISSVRRRMLHRRVAEALADLHSEQLDAVSGQIAVHFEWAGLGEQAIDYYRRAAQVASQFFAHEEAILLLRRALSLLANSSQEGHAGPPAYGRASQRAAQLYEQLGDLLGFVGQLDHAWAAFGDSLTQTPRQHGVQRARLYRKQGNIRRGQHNYGEAQDYYQKALSVLGPDSPTSLPEWWQEWIQIRLEQLWMRYWLDQWQEADDEIDQVQPIVETHGTSSQHINFLNCQTSLRMMRERLQPSSETVALREKALAICMRSGTPNEIAWTRFLLGFALLWQGQLDQCEEQLQPALALTEQTGDISLQVRCLTYLTLLHRKRNERDRVHQLVPRVLEVAMAVQMPEYVGVAQANLAWLAWREGDLAEVESHGQAALMLWQQVPTSPPFLWTALWPLIGRAFLQGQTGQAIDYLGQLSQPAQLPPLPHKFAEIVEHVQQAWVQGNQKTAHDNLQELLVLAEKQGYL